MAQQRRGGRRRRKVDFIAANHIDYIDYKDVDLAEGLGTSKRLFKDDFTSQCFRQPALAGNSKL